jgi:hypothetical protein
MVTAQVWSRQPTRSAPTLEEIEYGARAAAFLDAEENAPARSALALIDRAHLVTTRRSTAHLSLPHRWEIDEQTERRRPRRPTEEATP